MTTGLVKDRTTGIRYADLFTVDQPVPVLTLNGYGHGGLGAVRNTTFADRSGRVILNLGFDVDPRAEVVPLPRELGTANRPPDPWRVTLCAEIDRDTAFGFAMELLSIVGEYDRAFPVRSRSAATPTFRGR